MSNSFDSNTVYQKFLKGDPFTDQELVQGIEHFKRLERDLRELGPTFKLQADEVMRVWYGLESFHNERTKRKY